jgi:hypothetical protein
MIIDTTKIDPKELRHIAHIIYESRMFPDENGVYNAIYENDSCTVYYHDVIKDGKCKYQFGHGGKRFSLTGQSYDHKKLKEDRKNIKSLKGFPITCGEFSLHDYTIKEIDHLPFSDEYHISSCPVEKISAPFKEKVKDLWLTKLNITSFENFPKETDRARFNRIDVVSSYGIPKINESIEFEQCKKLEDLDYLTGDYEELIIKTSRRLKSLTITSKKAKDITIVTCPRLENIKGLDKLTESCKIYIEDCSSLDPYDVLQTDAFVEYKGKSFGKDKFYTQYVAFYKREFSKPLKKVVEPRGLSREQFEWEVLKYWTTDQASMRKALELDLKFESNIKKREQIIRSHKGIEKFKL